MSIWSPDIEHILDNIRLNSIIMSEEHKIRFLRLRGILRYFRLPVIIISGINSVVSVGFQPYIEQGTISAITCLLSLTCGIIGSIELYLAIQTQMDNESMVSKEYYLLSTSIYKTLKLEVENRKVDGMDFLEQCYTEYTELIGKSNVIAKKINDKLNPIDILEIENSFANKTDLESFYNISTHIPEIENPTIENKIQIKINKQGIEEDDDNIYI
jgi:hypothetical protein